MEERTLFFVKPDRIAISDSIYEFLTDSLKTSGEFIIDREGGAVFVDPFWEKFYSHVKDVNLKSYEEMIWSYSGRSVDLAFLEGPNIISRVRGVVGPTRFEANPDTIRGRFGPYELPHSIVHSSDSLEGFQKDYSLIREHWLFRI